MYLIEEQYFVFSRWITIKTYFFFIKMTSEPHIYWLNVLFFIFKSKYIKSMVICHVICSTYQKELYLMLEWYIYGFSSKSTEFVIWRPFCFLSKMAARVIFHFVSGDHLKPSDHSYQYARGGNFLEKCAFVRIWSHASLTHPASSLTTLYQPDHWLSL